MANDKIIMDSYDLINEAAIKSLSREYVCMYIIDLATGKFKQVMEAQTEEVKRYIENAGDAKKEFAKMSNYLVLPNQRDDMIKFTDIDSLAKRLEKTDRVSLNFDGPHLGWCESSFAVASRDENDVPTHVIFSVKSIKNEIEKDAAYKRKLMTALKEAEGANKKLTEQMHVISGLSKEYVTVWLVHVPDMEMQLYQDTGASGIESSVNAAKITKDFIQLRRDYVETYVHPDDKARVYAETTNPVIEKNINEFPIYKVNYRRVINDEIEYYQMGFAKAERNKKSRDFVLGFKNINLEVREEQNQKMILEKAFLAAEHANHAKTAFLNNMSHDIRTPMNAIIGFADLLEKNQDDPKIRGDYISKIQKSSAVLLSIINNVLEMARIEKGTIEVDETVWSTAQFNDTLYSVFYDLMKEKGIEFTRSIDIKHRYVYCDPIKLREVFINIISNAYKYTNPGGKVHMELRELPSTREGYAIYQTKVSDTGRGMSAAYLPHLYEEFVREKNTTDTKIEGTGLGMPIVKRLLDLMGGIIEVESEEGKGTTFTISVPHKIAKKEDANPENTTYVIRSDFTGKRILLVEDNDLNAEIASTVLEEVGFVVDRAEDGLVCIEKLNEMKADYYDAILMDIQMPNMNGYEATKAIRMLADSKKAYKPIIAMTANAFEEDKREAYKVGMNAHLSKPIVVKELLATLSRFIK